MNSINAARRSWALPLCWAAVLLDGFDLVVLGSVLPVLLRDRVWDMTPGTASVISTVGLVGMTIGAMAIGTITDVIGRRRALIIAVVLFSACTALCAIAPSAFVFGLLRFVAGIGLGGCLPTAITLVAEQSTSSGRATNATTTLMTGYHVGAMATALLGLVLIPALGWRAMFIAGALPALVLVPLLIKYLPDSAPQASPQSAKDTVASLFRENRMRITLTFWAVSFLGLLLVYGLNTWLPEIMRQAGYALGTSLSLLLVLNLGGVVGLLVAGRVGAMVGPRRATTGWFVGAMVFLALLSVRLPGPGLYVAVFLAGAFVFSAQVLLYAYVTHTYPGAIRATGLGWVAGVGRLGAICGPIVGGVLLTAQIAYPWGFYIFAAAALLAALANATTRKQAPQSSPAEQLQAKVQQ